VMHKDSLKTHPLEIHHNPKFFGTYSAVQIQSGLHFLLFSRDTEEFSG